MKFCIAVVLLLLNFSSFSQEKTKEEARKEIEAQKVAFVTQSMEFTPDEAALFWPLYNEMSQKMREKDFSIRESVQACKSGKLTDQQYKDYIEKQLEVEQEKMDIKKEYYHKFMLVIPAEKVCRLGWIEHKFNKMLLSRMQKHGNSGERK